MHKSHQGKDIYEGLPAHLVPKDYPEEVNDPRPKVLFAAIDSPGYSSAGMVKGFTDCGYNCIVFNWQTVRYNAFSTGDDADGGFTAMMQRLLQKALSEQPDLIFLHLQNEQALTPEIAFLLNQICTVVNYSFDVRTDLKWYIEIGKQISLTLFSDKDSVEIVKKEGVVADYMPASADFDVYDRLVKGDTYAGDLQIPEIVFIGNNYLNTSLDFPQAQERYDMVKFLEETYGNRFKAYGNNWTDSKIVNPQEEVLIYNFAKIAVTHNNFKHAGYQSDRTWRALGCGIYTVAQYYWGMNKDFDTSQIRTWINFEMLKEEIDKGLTLQSYRESVAENGYNRVRAEHTWMQRFRDMEVLLTEKYTFK